MKSPNIEFLCTREVETISVDATPMEAADGMEEAGVGSLVVMSADGDPVGMVTDRDLALRVVALGENPGSIRIGDVMTTPLASVQAEEGVEAVIELMKRAGIRRVPILKDGTLVGIVSMDDILQGLAWEMDDLGKETQSKMHRARSTVGSTGFKGTSTASSTMPIGSCNT